MCAAIKQHLKMKRHEAVLKMQNKQQTPQSFKQAKVTNSWAKERLKHSPSLSGLSFKMGMTDNCFAALLNIDFQ